MSAPLRPEAEVVIELALHLFDMASDPDFTPSEDDARQCAEAGVEVLRQYLRKLQTGAQPRFPPGIRALLSRIESGEFQPTSH